MFLTQNTIPWFSIMVIANLVYVGALPSSTEIKEIHQAQSLATGSNVHDEIVPTASGGGGPGGGGGPNPGGGANDHCKAFPDYCPRAATQNACLPSFPFSSPKA